MAWRDLPLAKKQRFCDVAEKADDDDDDDDDDSDDSEDSDDSDDRSSSSSDESSSSSSDSEVDLNEDEEDEEQTYIVCDGGGDPSKPFAQPEDQAQYEIPERRKNGKKREGNGRESLTYDVVINWDAPVPKCGVWKLDNATLTTLLAKRENGYREAFEAIEPAMVALSTSSRFGDNAEAAVMKWRSRHPDVLEVRNPKPGLQVDGKRTRKGKHAYDWLEILNVGKREQRAECKAGTMYYATTTKRWVIVFQNIKIGQFDVLFLCTATTKGLAIFEGDAEYVVGSGEKGEVNGDSIVWTASTKHQCPVKALESMLKKYGKKHTRIGTIAYDDPDYKPIFEQTTAGAQMFKDTPAAPLAALSGCMRGLVIEDIFEHVVASKIFAGHKLTRPTTDAEVGGDRNGQKRGSNAVAYDFLLDDRVRLEVKSMLLTWDTAKNRWTGHATCISFAAHDRLFLVLGGPDALHIVEHVGGEDGVGVSTRGKETDVCGHQIKICGCGGALEILDAWARVYHDKQMTKEATIKACVAQYIDAGKPVTAVDHMLKKLVYGGSVYVARVEL